MKRKKVIPTFREVTSTNTDAEFHELWHDGQIIGRINTETEIIVMIRHYAGELLSHCDLQEPERTNSIMRDANRIIFLAKNSKWKTR